MYFKSIDFECPALAVKTHTIVWLCRENKIAHRYLSFVQKYLYRTFIYENIQSVLILFSMMQITVDLSQPTEKNVSNAVRYVA